MLLAAAMGVGLSAAPIYSLGVFISPLNQAFGWSRADIAFAQVVMSIVVTSTAPLIGLALDRIGARRLGLCGTALMCAMMACLSLLKGSLALYFMTWALMAVGVASSSSVIWLKAVVERFTAKRGLALSIALCGSNVTGAIAPILAALLVRDYGWRTAYVGLATFLFVTSFPLSAAFYYDARDLRRRSAAKLSVPPQAAPIQSGATMFEAMRSRNFWLLALSFFLAGGGVTAFIVHFVPMETDLGLSVVQAASAISGLSIAAIIGRLLTGFLMDRFFAPRLAAFALALPVVAGLILRFTPPSYGSAFTAAVLFGLSTGAEFNMISFLTARYFGMRSYGVISGAMFGTFTAGAVVLPALVGELYSIYGDYRMAMGCLTAGFAVATVAILFCTDYPEMAGVAQVEQSPSRDPANGTALQADGASVKQVV